MVEPIRTGVTVDCAHDASKDMIENPSPATAEANQELFELPVERPETVLGR